MIYMERPILAIIVGYFLTIWVIRGFMYGLVKFYFNKSAVKKIEKSSNFAEKFFYSKYKSKIPKLFYCYYYIALAFSPIMLIVYIIFINIPDLKPYEIYVQLIDYIFNFIWLSLPEIFFWQKDFRSKGFKYDRWLKK